MKLAVILLTAYFPLLSFASENLAETDIKVDSSAKAEELSSVVKKDDAKTAKTQQAEDEILLNLENKKVAPASSTSASQAMMGLCLLVLMSGGAYYFVKYKKNPQQRKNAPQIKVVNQHWLGPKKSLALIHVAGENILIGVTDQNITHIKTLALLDDDETTISEGVFAQALKQKQNSTSATEVNPAAHLKTDAADREDDFQMKGLGQIKNSVREKLKSMRSLS